jgi:hypothetical protein
MLSYRKVKFSKGKNSKRGTKRYTNDNYESVVESETLNGFMLVDDSRDIYGPFESRSDTDEVIAEILGVSAGEVRASRTEENE